MTRVFQEVDSLNTSQSHIFSRALPSSHSMYNIYIYKYILYAHIRTHKNPQVFRNPVALEKGAVPVERAVTQISEISIVVSEDSLCRSWRSGQVGYAIRGRRSSDF